MAVEQVIAATSDANPETVPAVPAFLSNGSWSNLELAAAIVLTIGVVWLLLFLWERLQRRRVEAGSEAQSLFARLCDAHGLAPPERQQLERLVQRMQLSNPVLVFVDPRLLENVLVANGPPSDEIGHLGVKLFGPEFMPNGGSA